MGIECKKDRGFLESQAVPLNAGVLNRQRVPVLFHSFLLGTRKHRKRWAVGEQAKLCSHYCLSSASYTSLAHHHHLMPTTPTPAHKTCPWCQKCWELLFQRILMLKPNVFFLSYLREYSFFQFLFLSSPKDNFSHCFIYLFIYFWERERNTSVRETLISCLLH